MRFLVVASALLALPAGAVLLSDPAVLLSDPGPPAEFPQLPANIANDIEDLPWGGPQRNITPGFRDLVFMHVPYNFGHTIEYVAGFGRGTAAVKRFSNVMTNNLKPSESLRTKWAFVEQQLGEEGEVWGATNPLLLMESAVGCPLYMTPPHLWPKSIARKYFGQRKSFGILRDPYERLVALFRGSAGGETGSSYGGNYSRWAEACDVDSAIRSMLEGLSYENKYSHGCTFVPQHEYFEGKHRIEIILDNRMYPASVNDLLVEHHYEEMVFEPHDIIHITGCYGTWAAHLSEPTKELVRKFYAKDFELLCKTFGYCDDKEVVCEQYIPMMCPANISLVDARPGQHLYMVPAGDTSRPADPAAAVVVFPESSERPTLMSQSYIAH